MKNLTSKLASIGLSIVLLAGMNGCATNSDYYERRKYLEEQNLRETSFSQDGISTYLSPFGFKHRDE